MHLFIRLFAVISCCCLSSCGYVLVSPSSSLVMKGGGIFLEPIEQDSLGQLTSAVTYSLEKRALSVCSREEQAQFLLRISLMNAVDENIGFTYAPSRESDPSYKHFIVADEGRLSLSAKVSVLDTESGDVLFEECISRESVSFGFEPDLGTVNAHQFALGQFEMHNEALECASRALYISLAEAIVQRIYYDLF